MRGEVQKVRVHRDAVAFHQTEAADVDVSLRLTIQVRRALRRCLVGGYAESKAHLAGPVSFLSPIGRGWPKPGAALGLLLPL